MEHAHTSRWFKPASNALFPKLRDPQNPEPARFIEDLPFEEYLSKRDAISSSGLRKVMKSPRHYLADMIGLQADEDEEKDHFRFGRAAHLLILEPEKFKRLHVVEPKFTGLTQDGRESTRSKDAGLKRDAWRKSLDPEAVIIAQEEADDLTHMVNSLMDHSTASNLLKNGRPEVTGFFNDEETGIACKIRPDYLSYDKDGRLYLTDLKTTRDASQGLFSNDVARHKYHAQLAHYVDGIKAITGKAPEGVGIIAVEKKAPYTTAVYWFNEEDIEEGRRWNRFAMHTLYRCIKTNEWPGIQSEGQMLSLPHWTKNEMLPSFDWKQQETK